MDVITLALAKKYAREKINETAGLGWKKLVVDALPQQNPDPQTIYLVRDGNNYNEYIWDRDSSIWIFLATIGEISADKNYIFEQTTPISMLTINHNLAKKPAVSVIDTNGDLVLCDVNYIGSNSVSLSFSEPFTGTITLN